MLFFLSLLLFLLLLEDGVQQTTSPVTAAIRTMIVNMHNYRRSRLAQGLVPNGRTGRRAPRGRNIYKIRYSTTLENDAQAYADNCTTTGSPVTSRPTQGENFDRIPSTTATSYQNAIRRAIRRFWYEIKQHGINQRMLFTQHLLSRPAAPLRFTQMAWASTYEVGCGAKLCTDNYYVVVCRYNPRGNMPNQNIYNRGRPCAQCPGRCTTAFLYKGLCIAP